MRRKILLGLTGSVASILYEKLIDELGKIGEVSVIITDRSKHFLNLPSLYEALDRNKNKGTLFRDEMEWKNCHYKWHKNESILHIDLKNQYSALVIAPCSANTMAKISNGMADNLLTSVARAWDFNRPFVVAPAMNTEMWYHPVTSEQLSKLSKWGVQIVPPQSKMLACKTEGMGAMAEIKNIVETVKNSLRWYLPIKSENFSGIPVGNHPGAFSTQRKHEKHTGLDLYCEDDTLVYAVESGTVVAIEHFTGAWDHTPWWENTDCVMVEGASGVVCYGEVDVPAWVQVGSKVEARQYIARVKRVLKKGKERPDIPGHSTSMLHMELYPHGTRKPSNGFEEHLLNDPAPFLWDAYESYKVKELNYDGPKISPCC